MFKDAELNYTVSEDKATEKTAQVSDGLNLMLC